ncbi:MAG: peptidylprolyl isomerase [Gemmataceae bacterium]
MLSWLARGSLVAVLLAPAGCGKAPPADKPAETAPASAPEVARKVDPEPEKPAAPKAAPRDALHRSFVEATRPADSVPVDAQRPPDTLMTGKPVFKVLEAVIASWDGIRFVDEKGNKVRYVAHLHTNEGVVEVALFPEQAPNHVRNFIALAQAGYYDGLCFDRARLEQIDEGGKFESLEGGCPEGKGEQGMGSIGYWLKDELTDAKVMSHEEGAFGACSTDESDTAACRFYICLSKAPFLDGSYTLFGKVTKGLDVARKIYQMPVTSEDREREGGRRPEKPVVVHKVSIIRN